jgi:hypothetical protein
MTTPAVVRAFLTASLLGWGAAAATAQPVADRASIGRDVRVILSDGTQRRGELVSLSSTDVHVRERRGLFDVSVIDHRTALTEVRRIETAHHATRYLALAGLAAGVIAGGVIDFCGPAATPVPPGVSEPRCFSVWPALTAAGGAAVGAIVGGVIDRSRRRVLYTAPISAPRVHVSLGRHGGSIGMAFHWE